MGGSMDRQDGNLLKKAILRMAPGSIHNLIFRFILNKTINKNQEVCKRLKEIKGKAFLLEADDIKRSYCFYVDDGSVKVDFDRKRRPDVIMQGDFDTFLRLFLHKEDADSLFFSRRLVIKGDIKTSVFFKNLLEHL